MLLAETLMQQARENMAKLDQPRHEMALRITDRQKELRAFEVRRRRFKQILVKYFQSMGINF